METPKPSIKDGNLEYADVGERYPCSPCLVVKA
jgi:hypothetical protein